MDEFLLSVSQSVGDQELFVVENDETDEPVASKCDLRASDFMKLRRITADRIILDVPKKETSKSLNAKLLSAGRKVKLLSRLKPQQKNEDNKHLNELGQPAIEEPVAVKLISDTSNNDDDPLNRKIN